MSKERNDIVAYLLDAHVAKDREIQALQAQLAVAKDEADKLKKQVEDLTPKEKPVE